MNDIVNMLETAKKEAKRTREKAEKFQSENANEFARIVRGLDVVKEWVIRFAITNSFDINIAGDHYVYKGTVAALRELGYNTNDRPKEEKFASYSNWWHHPDNDVGIWFSFSSTKCTRKKVGTKMVEEPIYEVICE